jgi:hypothetical protein
LSALHSSQAQKLLCEFSLAYMVADLFFFLLPFTPDGEWRCRC